MATKFVVDGPGGDQFWGDHRWCDSALHGCTRHARCFSDVNALSSARMHVTNHGARAHTQV